MGTPREIELKVMTINVWSGLDYQGLWKMGEFESASEREQRFQVLVQNLGELQPDLLAIQEANKLPAYAKRLARALGMETVWRVGLAGVRMGPFGLPWNLREGTALLARPGLGLTRVGNGHLTGGKPGSIFSFHLNEAIGILGARLDNGLYAFVTHWSANDTRRYHQNVRRVADFHSLAESDLNALPRIIKEGRELRARQARNTVNFINKVAGDSPFLLFGDLNAFSDSPEIQVLEEAGLRDLFRRANPEVPGYTWEPKSNINYKRYLPDINEASPELLEILAKTHTGTARRLDYIFAGPDSERLDVRSAQVVLAEARDGIHVSDHYGVAAQVFLRES